MTETFHSCEICHKELKISLESPLYCIACIEEMDKRGMTPAQYKKQLRQA